MFNINWHLNEFLCDTYVCQSYIKYSTTASNEQYENWSYIKKYDGFLIMYGWNTPWEHSFRKWKNEYRKIKVCR